MDRESRLCRKSFSGSVVATAAEPRFLQVSESPRPQNKRGEGFYVFVDNDAMVDAGIHCNDLVVANADETVESGAIIVARLNGQMLVRRYFKSDQGEFLSPENVSYPTLEVDQNQFNICGVVTKVIHSLR